MPDKSIYGKYMRLARPSAGNVFLLVSGICVLIILLTLLQDYLYANWNQQRYNTMDSLVFKLFWLLFIPFYLLLVYLHQTFYKFTRKQNSRIVLSLVVLPLALGSLHLLLFAYSLHLFSIITYSAAWDLLTLIQEKFSTRLYLVIVAYVLFGYIEFRRYQTAPTSRYTQNLTIKNGSKTTLIPVSQIKWISTDSGYLEVQTNEKKHLMNGSLKNLQMILDPDEFKRIHKSTILNVSMIDSFKSRHNGDYDVHLTDGNILRLSRNYVKSLRALLSGSHSLA